DPAQSQPTQLIEYALAAPAEHVEHGREWAPIARKQRQDSNNSNNSNKDFSEDSIVPPRRETATRYRLHDQSAPPSQHKSDRYEPSEWGSQKENAEPGIKVDKEQRRNTNGPRFSSPYEALTTVKVSNPDPLNHPNIPFTSSSTGRGDGTRALSFEPPSNSKNFKPRSVIHTAKSMPPISNRYRRSPSPQSQDSFGGPVPRDPEAQFLATTKQFNVPLSDLGETPTQQIIHDDVGPDIPLSDATKHHTFLATTDHGAQPAAGQAINSDFTGRVLVIATPSHTSESVASSSAADARGREDQYLGNVAAEQDSQESSQPFDFNQTPSSFDRLLDKEAAAGTSRMAPEPEPTQPAVLNATLTNASTRAEPPTLGAAVEESAERHRSETPQWVSPAANVTLASSNPRSLIRMVNPLNEYRLAKLRQMHADNSPPSYVSNSVRTGRPQSRVDEVRALGPRDVQQGPSQAQTSDHHIRYRQSPDQGPDAMDVVPDSEPLRVGHGADTSTRSPQKRSVRSRPLSPQSEHGIVHGPPIGEESPSESDDEADVPLSTKLSAKMAQKVPAIQNEARTRRKPKSAPVAVSSVGNATNGPDQGKTLTDAKGKGPARGKGNSKKEPTIVPSSVPTQDLQRSGSLSKERSAVTSSRAPAPKRQKAKQPIGAPKARSTSTTKKAAKRKRSQSSDTESVEGYESGGIMTRLPDIAKREEEEETELADDGELDPISLPVVSKAGESQKRRRVDDLKPGGGSKGSTSTRKQSETPVPATRSAKRLRSGMSTNRALNESATRVFALWKQDGHYYSGTIHSAVTLRGTTKYLVKFDDGTDDQVDLKNMRRCELMVGDNVILVSNGTRAQVSDVGELESRGVFQIKVDDGERIATLEVEFADIRIANRTLQGQWKNRILDRESIVPLVKPKPLCDTGTPSKQSLASLPGKPVRKLAKTGFVVTLSVKNTDPDKTKDDTMMAIKQYGGQLIDDWSSVFTMEGKHSQSNKRWAVTPEDFRLREDVTLDRVFLLADDANQKPKFLIALALGIPCLSFEWLTRDIKFSPDWQPFLLPAGYSDALGARISQLVDLDWGNCTEYLQDILSNKVAPKLFSNKTFLCVGSDFVPPHRNRKNTNAGRGKEAACTVPWIILCMGASRVEAITDIKQVTSKELRSFDYVIVKDVEDVEDLGTIMVASVAWVKECLISSRIIPMEWDQS
ncbi:hypothetical protein ID866_6555, partial [Astraeus odoratus]